MTDTTLVVLAEYNTVAEAEIAKSLLESAGIEVSLRNELMSSNYPMAIPAQLVVREEDYETARGLLTRR
ncbi:DUF2007 domain-containing protein [uncultured Alistipes sp.]|jgi:hypothetical protein|uniref:putative signal transducing protein n=1 Tax=uncultured Alistipes sp. TaxID=538949 RepID=UPI002638AE97|nr:DUF2007 domain-containing protein [uncultured Alistipes sp.]